MLSSDRNPIHLERNVQTAPKTHLRSAQRRKRPAGTKADAGMEEVRGEGRAPDTVVEKSVCDFTLWSTGSANESSKHVAYPPEWHGEAFSTERWSHASPWDRIWEKLCMVVNGKRHIILWSGLNRDMKSWHKAIWVTSSSWTVTKTLNLNIAELLVYVSRTDEFSVYINAGVDMTGSTVIFTFLVPCLCRVRGHVGDVSWVRWCSVPDMKKLTPSNMYHTVLCLDYMNMRWLSHSGGCWWGHNTDGCQGRHHCCKQLASRSENQVILVTVSVVLLMRAGTLWRPNRYFKPKHDLYLAPKGFCRQSLAERTHHILTTSNWKLKGEEM